MPPTSQSMPCIGASPNGILSSMGKHKGFTIVELLVVIVVIGILAAISIITYSGIQARARDSTVQSDLSAAMKKLAMYAAEKDAPTTTTALRDTDISITKSVYRTSGHNVYYCVNRTTGDYALGATTKNDHHFLTSSGNSSVQSVANISAGLTCQSIGLTSHTDSNAYYSLGYNNSTASWASWVQ